MENIFRSDLFTGKTVLITGGGSGIGLAIAQNFGTLGARVVIAARDQKRLIDAGQSLRETGVDAIEIIVNIRDSDSVTSLIEQLELQGVGIDVLVNNAGGQFAAPALDLSANGFRSVVDLNLTGTFLMCQAFARHCMNRKLPGCIINIVLCQANGLPGMAHAGAAREGVVNLTRTLAWEWSNLGIRVNAVAPGTIETEALDQYDPVALQEGINKLLIKRMGLPEEVAQSVAYLASPAAGFITGTCLALDGGEHLTGASPQR